MQAKVFHVLDVMWKFSFLCMYISTETIVGLSTGLLVFISAFQTKLYKLRKRSKVNKLGTVAFRLALGISPNNSNSHTLKAWY